MAFTVTTSTLNAKTARLITGSGNLTDLATALATHGVTMVGNSLLFSGTGAPTYYRIDGALTEQRRGVWNIRIGVDSCVCFAGNGGTTVLGGRNAQGNLVSIVDIVALTTRFAVGGDRFSQAEYDCHIGSGTYRQYGGSIWYESCAAGRSDFDLWQSAASIVLDGVVLGFTSGGSFSHIFTSANISVLGGTHVEAGAAPAEAGIAAQTIYSFSTTAGIRCLYGVSGYTWTIYQPMYPNVDHYTNTTNQIYIDVVDGVNRYYGAVGGDGSLLYNNMRLWQTLRATFKDPLGVSVSSPTPKLVSVLPDTTTVVSNYSAGAATYRALQSTHAARTAYSAAGVGWTNLGNYSFYSVGYGYAAKYEGVNVGTAFVGITGVPWSAVSAKSPLCVTAYASVVTAGFSLDTGTNTLTVSAALTTSQAAEFLFKHAYDNPELAYWRTRSHTPATLDGEAIDFGSLNIVVGSGGTLSGSSLKTTGTVTTTGIGTLDSAIVVQDASGLSVPIVVGGTRNGTKVRVVRTDTEAEIAIGTSGAAGFAARVSWTTDHPIRADSTYTSGLDCEQEASALGTLTANGALLTVVQEPCTVYETNGLVGADVTGLVLDAPNVEADADEFDNRMAVQEFYAWYKYTLMSDAGIRTLFGAITAENAHKYRVNASKCPLKIDQKDLVNTLLFTGGLIYRDDGESIRLAGSGSIEMIPTDVYESPEAEQSLAAIKAKTDALSFTVPGQVDANIQYVNDVAVTGNGQAGTEWGPG